MLIRNKASRTVRGFTLTEAAIVLGIVGLIISAIWVAAGSVYTNYRIKTTNEQILSIAQGVRSLYAQSVKIESGISAQDLIKAGVFPSDMLGLNGTTQVANHVWGSPGTESVFITAADCSGGTTCSSFVIQYTGIPTKVCVDLLVRNTQGAKDVGLAYANGGSAASVAATAVPPVSLANAISSCGTADTANVFFTFKVRGS